MNDHKPHPRQRRWSLISPDKPFNVAQRNARRPDTKDFPFFLLALHTVSCWFAYLFIVRNGNWTQKYIRGRMGDRAWVWNLEHVAMSNPSQVRDCFNDLMIQRWILMCPHERSRRIWLHQLMMSDIRPPLEAEHKRNTFLLLCYHWCITAAVHFNAFTFCV